MNDFCLYMVIIRYVICRDICKIIFREMYGIQICQAHIYIHVSGYANITKEIFKKLYLQQLKTIKMAY